MIIESEDFFNNTAPINRIQANEKNGCCKFLKIETDNPKIIEFLKLIDVLVDGPFILEKKSLDCVFRGSTNQRIIDTKLSLKNKEVVLVDKYYTEKKVKNKRDRIYI